mmetsp:Transcript_23605/g.51335  ORF Transcript_23605/g.51335 Transcript_23605/m.51335 type:complete len:783 (-) Transcript_23605:301-2649(-)
MDCCCAFLRPIPDSQKRISIRDAEPAERDPKVTVEDVSPVRTGADARASIRLLKEGNTRFTSGNTLRKTTNDTMRKELEIAEAPHCAIIGCADSQVPLETIFDSSPGDIFALRNAGNTCTHAEGSMVGSLEFCISKLKSRLILVLGHTHCSAVYGATKAYFDTVQAAQAGPPDRSERASTALEGLLQDLSCIAEQAASEVGRDGRDGEFEEVAIHAVKINVFHTINFLLKYSSQIRQMVRRRQVEIQGGIYDLASGHVEFLGCSPDQEELLSSKMPLPLSVAARSSNNPLKGVRTASDSWMTAKQALEVLKEGNSRFVLGTPLAKAADDQMREALVNQGQAPHTAVLGCADSRVPVDIIFDAMPGDMFVLRNAGNTCTHAEGSMLGSLEFCASKLGSKLILVLGHTNCSALTGAAQAYQKSQENKGQLSQSSRVSTALEGLLTSLSTVSKRSADSLGPNADFTQLIAHSAKVNVFHSIDFMLKYSLPIRELVKNGGLEIHGAIYRLETGRVDFLGPSPNQTQLLSSEHHLPPSMATLPMRKESDGPVPPRMSLKLLKEGNERFVNGNQSAKISNCERRALAEDGQAPHCAIIGCADSRAPLETIFDAMPGDIFALRNAGNTCTHTEGSMLGSLEFCTSTLGTRLILVLGHTQCSAIKGATKMFLQSGGVEPTENRALDALFAGLTTVVEQAASELGCYATEEAIVSRATKLNIYRSINFLLQYSEIIREQVDEGELEIQGGIYDLETGSVHFLGRSPFHAEVLKSESSPSDSSWTFEKVAGS